MKSQTSSSSKSALFSTLLKRASRRPKQSSQRLPSLVTSVPKLSDPVPRFRPNRVKKRYY